MAFNEDRACINCGRLESLHWTIANHDNPFVPFTLGCPTTTFRAAEYRDFRVRLADGAIVEERSDVPETVAHFLARVGSAGDVVTHVRVSGEWCGVDIAERMLKQAINGK